MIHTYACAGCKKVLNAMTARFLVQSGKKKILISRLALRKKIDRHGPVTYSRNDIYCDDKCMTVKSVLLRMRIV